MSSVPKKADKLNISLLWCIWVVLNVVIINLGNAMSPFWYQAITITNAYLFAIEQQEFAFRK